MQVEEQEHFIKRSLFYICMAIANLAKKGKMESKGKKIPYNYNIPVVYSLSFLNFDLDFGKNCDEVVQHISLHNVFHPDVRYDHINMTFVRLSKFAKTAEECKSDIDRMLFTFKNVHKLERVPPSFNKMVFKHIFEIARISNFNVEELMFYESEMKRYSDHINALAYAEKKGVARGVLRTAKNMLGDGVKPALVARYTELPLETVKALR
jgi:predicted transposase/invertase (TIGR01784 family)